MHARDEPSQQREKMVSVRVSSNGTPKSNNTIIHVLAASSHLRDENGIMTLRYEDAMEGKPPIPVTVPPPRVPPTEPHPALRSPPSTEDPEKRDSALASSVSTTDTSTSSKMVSNTADTNTTVDCESSSILSPSPTTPSHAAPERVAKEESNGSTPPSLPHKLSNLQTPTSLKSVPSKRLLRLATGKKKDQPSSPVEAFSPIDTEIPTDDLIEMDFLKQMQFSKRGSMLWPGKTAASSASSGSVRPRLSARPLKVLPPAVVEESQKVRSLYDSPEDSSMNWRDGRVSPFKENEDIAEETVAEDVGEATPDSKARVPHSYAALANNRGSAIKREHELAGGVEDWEDIEGGDVDRYGFINMRQVSDTRPGTPEPRPPQRVSTVLQLASETPRQQRRLLGRSPSNAKSNRSLHRFASRKTSGRSLRTNMSNGSSNGLTPIRTAVNYLPGNKDRRTIDEAGDMLTLPPGLADIAEDDEGGKAAEVLKMKEWSRSEKWRKMAKVIKTGDQGAGIGFEFDVMNSKLIERTWKGIPDRWRSTAWFSFLSASAMKNSGSASDQELIEAFHGLIEVSSEDDVQIDIDVPRTINSHIMFRRRYRGGQRLLFRVLHCLSLYFPDTGYVQGMASLAATLLCYYDEENTFIMLVRMWQLRGIEKLYANGFGGLMSALKEFSTVWMSGGEIAKQLNELGIEDTSYCTRWYLTLFNYSIPFPAQLRVWDVFMLLGDADPAATTTERPFGGSLDIIHAAGAALLEGTREILLDSDFENAMKVLTSWIPVKDEEMFLSITKVKWKQHHVKRGRAKTLSSQFPAKAFASPMKSPTSPVQPSS